MTNTTERATIPAHEIPTSRGSYRFSLGDGVDDEYDRGVYRTRKNSADEWYWYPVAPLPYVTERIMRREGDVLLRVDYRLAATLDHPGVIVTDDEVVKGEWSGRLDMQLASDMDITRATATAIRYVARHSGTVTREARAQWTPDGHLALPPVDLLPAGYAVAPSDPEDAPHALREACQLAVEHPKVALVMGAAFGGVYTRALGRESFWMLTTGQSSRGKTSALTAAAALLGDPGDPQQDPQVVRRWNTSPVGLGQWLGTVGCLPVCFDEMGTAGFTQAKWEESVFRSVEGASRTVGGKTGDAKTSAGWRGVLLATGNRSIVDHAINEAVSARVVEIPTPIVTNGVDAKRLVSLASRYRGWALQQIMTSPRVEEMATYFAEAARLSEGREGIGERLAEHLALAVTGARMLGELVDVHEMHQAAKSMAESLLDSLLDELAERGANPGERLLAAVAQAYAARPASFPTRNAYDTARSGVDGGRLPREIEGFTLNETDHHTEVCVMTDFMPRIAIDAGMEDYMVGLKMLRDQGILITNKNLRKQVRISATHKIDAYSFRLTPDDDESVPASDGGQYPPVPAPIPEAGTDSKPVTSAVPAVPAVPASGAKLSRESESPQARRRGVLDVDGLHLPGQDLPEPVDLPESLAEAYAIADRFNLSQLWIHPRAVRGLELIDADVRRASVRRDGDGLPHPWADLSGSGLEADPDGLAPWSVVWRASAGRRESGRSIVIPTYDNNRAPWHEAEDGADLLAGIERYADLTGNDFYRSTNTTATHFVKDHSRSIEACQAILRKTITPAHTPTEMITPQWSRPLLDTEDGSLCVIRYDLRHAELSGMNTWLGCGEPVHEKATSPDGLTWNTAAQRRAGYWRIEDVPTTDPRLPELRFRADTEGAIWLATPDVALLEDLGLRPPLVESITWPDSRQGLQTVAKHWQSALQIARDDKHTPVGKLTYGAIGRTYKSFIGLLASKDGPRCDSNGEPDDDPFYRPDHRDMIKAQTYANMYRQLRDVGRETGRYPVARSADAAYYTADTIDPAQAAPIFHHAKRGKTAGIVLGTGGGQWQPEAYAFLSDVRDQLGTRRFFTTFADVELPYEEG